MNKDVLAEGVEIYRADFRDAMPEVGPVAHILTDCPYEQRSHDATGKIRRNDGKEPPKKLSFDGIDLMRDDVLRFAKVQCSGWVLCFCTTEGVAAWRDSIEAAEMKYKTPCIWNKPDSMPKFNGSGPSHGHECIVTAWCGSGHSSWNGGGRRGMFTHPCNPSSRHGLHSTEKPVSLMMELVGLFTNPGDLICDPFAGTGATGLACIRLGRKFIGIELQENYYTAMKERLVNEISQGVLFVPQPRMKQGKLCLQPEAEGTSTKTDTEGPQLMEKQNLSM